MSTGGATDPYIIRDERRVAADTIRGFLAQVLLCVDRWLSLQQGEVLIVEGNEDIDTKVLRGGELLAATEESVKDLATRISARGEAAYETMANFAQAFDYYDRHGIACHLMFTTTAALARQELTVKKGPELPFDVLKEWIAFLDGKPASKSPKELYNAVVRVVKGYINLRVDKTTRTALLSIARRGRVEAFLRAVSWRFEAPKVSELETGIIDRLTALEGGNAARAGAIAEALIVRVWGAAASSITANRSLTPKDLTITKGRVVERHARWAVWERMRAFTSWASWNGDHITLSAVSSGQGSDWSAVVVGVCFLPLQTEARLRAVMDAAAVDRVIDAETRALIAKGELTRAFWLDPTIRVRFLDAFHDTDLQFYGELNGAEVFTREDVLRTLRVRRSREDRQPLDFATDERVAALWPRLKRQDRPSTVFACEVVGTALGRWFADQDAVAGHVLRWFHPRFKLLRDQAGKYHRYESPIWGKLY